MANSGADSPPRSLEVTVGSWSDRALGEFGPDVLKELQVPAFMRRKSALASDTRFIRGREEDIRRDIGDRKTVEVSISEATGLVFPEPPKIDPVQPLAPDASRPPLSALLNEIDLTGGQRVLTRELLAKYAIAIESDESAAVDLEQAARQVSILVTALEEASDFNLRRHHNHPPPALWVGNDEYLSDLRILLVELRRLNDHLAATPNAGQAKDLEKSSSLAMVAGKKFVESYSEVMGKGAAALTIGAVAMMLVSFGVDKGTVNGLWNLLKSGK